MTAEIVLTVVVIAIVTGGALFAVRISKKRTQNQSQVVGDGGSGIQSGRDTKIDTRDD